MYQVEAGSALRNAIRAVGLRCGAGRVSRNVLALGLTSLLTDISSEMVATVLPVYVVLHLGLTPLHFGVVDGLYNGATAALRLVGGAVADRWRRHKAVAAVGYGVSAACKVGLLVSGGVWPLIAGVVAFDRAAKGLRGAPRDALISFSSPQANLAMSFGVHRMFDATGAMLGPLAALLVLVMVPNGFDLVFASSFSFAVVGVAVLVLFVENVQGSLGAASLARVSLAVRPLVDTAGFFKLIVAASLLSLATVSDGFIYLLLQQQAGFNAGLFPLLYVGTAGSYLLLAVPVGAFADRIGRRTTFVYGYALLALVYLAAVSQGSTWVGLVLCLALLGGYYATTDGVLMALASAMLPANVRGTGLAVLATTTSLGRLVASLVFGGLWTVYGPVVSCLSFCAALLVAIGLAAVALRGIPSNG